MPQELRSIQKLGLNTHQAADTVGADTEAAPRAAPPMAHAAVVATATLELSVTKTGGPVATFVEVGSSGSDDQVFNDHQLDPGPVRKPLLQGNFYTVVRVGATRRGAILTRCHVTRETPPLFHRQPSTYPRLHPSPKSKSSG